MKDKIEYYLQQLEKEKDIRILFACETGSRAWGFASPDSDYDIRVLYVHELDWYLSLSDKKDDLVLMAENNDIDITGWELRKSLRLLNKSNVSMIERLQSPIHYRCDPEFLEKMLEITKANYSRKAAVYHYKSMAGKFLDDMDNSSSYKLKGFFYALRACSACKWILDRKELPPIEFMELLNGIEMKSNLMTRIKELIALKATVDESYMHKEYESDLFHFMQACLDRVKLESQNLPTGNGSWEASEAFFKKVVMN